MSDSSGESDSGLMYRDWAIALGATTAVFLVTTLVLAGILFIILCRKISKLRKERHSRETRVHQGVTSPHWIDNANLNDMLEHDQSGHEKPMQNLWTISTQTFDSKRAQQPPTTPQTSSSADGGALASSQERGEIEKSLSVSVSPTVSGEKQTVKPNRSAPSPPKTRKRAKSRDKKTATGEEQQRHEEATPYVYPLHKIKQESAPKSTGGDQSHEYAQPHVHTVQATGGSKEPRTQNGDAKKKHEYLAIDPKLKQPTGQYQDLLHNGMPRGNSLPAMSTFAAMNSS